MAEHIEEQKGLMNEEGEEEQKKTCLVIMPFSEPPGYSDEHFRRVYDYLIVPACEQAGFHARRVDENAKTSVIVMDILKMIVEEDIAICDISGRNPNVFYELGLRQAFDKRCVLIKDNKTEWPFDVNMLRTQDYDSSLRVDCVKEFVPRLAQAILETYSNKELDGNSLIHLLSIQGPAKIPDGKKMSDDISYVLSAIQSLSVKIDGQRSYTPPFNHKSFMLPNAELVSIGDEIVSRSSSQSHPTFYVIKGFGDGEVFVQQRDGTIAAIPMDEREAWENVRKRRMFKY